MQPQWDHDPPAKKLVQRVKAPKILVFPEQLSGSKNMPGKKQNSCQKGGTMPPAARLYFVEFYLKRTGELTHKTYAGFSTHHWYVRES